MNSPCEQGQLCSIAEAIEALSQLLARPVEAVEVALEEASGRLLAQDLPVRLDMPRHDNSAMDGYALHSASLDPTHPLLPLAGRMAAGDPPRALPTGHCMQIFTGAALPLGADSVIAQEQTRLEAGQVVFDEAAKGQNIRRQGEELRAGEPLLGRGIRLRAQEIGLLASQGYARVPVCSPLRIGIISCGNELQAPGMPLQEGQIHDANRYLLASLLQGWGLAVTHYPHLRDSLDDTLALLARASQEQDILISSGGVSVGEADHIKTAVRQLGELRLWRVAIQPGKPLAFGRIAGTPWIGLPGNPGASLVTALIIARPALLTALGQAEVRPLALPVEAAFTRNKAPARQLYLQAELRTEAGRLRAELHPKQGSAMLANASWADGLVVLPPEYQVRPGDLLEFLPYQSLL